MTSASALLKETEDAIRRCLTAQAYTAYGRTKQMAQLRELRELRRQLLDEVDAESNGGSMTTLLQLQEPK